MKNDKIFLDNSGTVLKVGDRIMYVTDGPCINYGYILKIEFKTKHYGGDRLYPSISVMKEKGMHRVVKQRKVMLTYHTVFKCDVVLPYPTETQLQGVR